MAGKCLQVRGIFLCGVPKLIHLRLNGYTFRGSKSVIFIFTYYLIRVPLVKRKICSHGSEFFPLRVDSILGRLRSPGNAKKKSRKLSPFENMVEKDGGVPLHNNVNSQNIIIY